MAEPWELSPAQREAVRSAGHSEEDIDAYEQKQKARYEKLLTAARRGLSPERFATYHLDRWDIEHECHCAADVLNDEYTAITDCEYEVFEKVKERLELALVDSLATEDVLDQLRMQVVELGGTPRA